MSSSSCKDMRKSSSRDKRGRDKHSRQTKSHEKPKEDEELKREKVEKKSLLEVKRKLKKKEKEREREKEDGEVSGEDSSSEENELPVCRFHSTNSCTWGHNCRFRHPGSKSMGNYVMFERLKLPLLPEPTDFQGIVMGYPQDLDSSFDHSLRDLKQMMQDAGYKVGQNNNRYVRHEPWIQFNDLDTDPYYTNHNELPDYSNVAPHQPHEGCPPWLTNSSRKVTLQYNRSSSSSSSSTSDYTSTTSSTSSSSSSSSKSVNLRKRKLTFSQRSSAKRRKGGDYSCPYSSDSATYESSTHSSELSSSSSDLNTKYESNAHNNSSDRKAEFERRRRKYLQRKLKYVEAKIVKKEKDLSPLQ
ncbi:hypothetical protein ACLKA7_004381 [Drosophila subpalustris]